MARAIVGPGPLLMAIGEPRLKSYAQAISVALMLIAIVPLTLRFGLGGAAAAAVLRSVAGKALLLAFAARRMPELRAGLRDALLRPALSTALASIPAVALSLALAEFPWWLRLGLPLLTLASAFLVLTTRIDPGATTLLARQWQALRTRRALS